jgi:hypothetical protein
VLLIAVAVQHEAGDEFLIVLSGRFKVYSRDCPASSSRPSSQAAATATSSTESGSSAWMGMERASLSEGDSYGDQLFDGSSPIGMHKATVVCSQNGSTVAVVRREDYETHFLSNTNKMCFAPQHAIEVFKKEYVAVCG